MYLYMDELMFLSIDLFMDTLRTMMYVKRLFKRKKGFQIPSNIYHDELQRHTLCMAVPYVMYDGIDVSTCSAYVCTYGDFLYVPGTYCMGPQGTGSLKTSADT